MKPPTFHTQTWQLTALLALIFTILIFLLNLALLAWYVSGGAPVVDVDDGVKVLYAGDCNKTARIDTAVHLGVNVVGTVLIGGSNFCMLFFLSFFSFWLKIRS